MLIIRSNYPTSYPPPHWLNEWFIEIGLEPWIYKGSMNKQSNKHKLSDREVERAGISTPIIYSYTPHSHYDSIKNDLSIDDKPKFAEKNKKVKVWMGPNWTFDSVRSREALYFNNGESFCRVRGLINKMRKKVKVKFGRKKKKGDYYCPI